MTAGELRPWLALLRVPGLGPARGRRLLERFGSPAAAFDAGAAAWRGAGLDDAFCQALAEPDWAGVDLDLGWLEQSAASAPRALITRDDPRYPPQLAEISAAPLALFVHGDPELLRLPQLAVVGARSASAQGAENAQAFAAELARRGLTVTSGLALGIDAAAHRGALAADGFTLAVCGNGLDRVYPARNRELAHAIAARGLLVSEFPTGVAPLPEHFPRRNRIISGLSLGVLVVEAARESGSLITARLAAEQGREVFAIPGSIHNPLARGCHALIREGAKLVETVDDILAELAPLLPAARAAASPARPPAPEPADGGDPDRQRVLQALGFETLSLDHLVSRLGLPVERISAALLRLELDGLVAAGPGDTFTRLQSA
ncbi:MAG: DNA-processing protein DprA [Nevskia sp.]|nr:DNA-processing protein DprA [Nevskia sp.]